MPWPLGETHTLPTGHVVGVVEWDDVDEGQLAYGTSSGHNWTCVIQGRESIDDYGSPYIPGEYTGEYAIVYLNSKPIDISKEMVW